MHRLCVRALLGAFLISTLTVSATSADSGPPNPSSSQNLALLQRLGCAAGGIVQQEPSPSGAAPVYTIMPAPGFDPLTPGLTGIQLRCQGYPYRDANLSDAQWAARLSGLQIAPTAATYPSVVGIAHGNTRTRTATTPRSRPLDICGSCFGTDPAWSAYYADITYNYTTTTTFYQTEGFVTVAATETGAIKPSLLSYLCGGSTLFDGLVNGWYGQGGDGDAAYNGIGDTELVQAGWDDAYSCTTGQRVGYRLWFEDYCSAYNPSQPHNNCSGYYNDGDPYYLPEFTTADILPNDNIYVNVAPPAIDCNNPCYTYVNMQDMRTNKTKAYYFPTKNDGTEKRSSEAVLESCACQVGPNGYTVNGYYNDVGQVAFTGWATEFKNNPTPTYVLGTGLTDQELDTVDSTHLDKNGKPIQISDPFPWQLLTPAPQYVMNMEHFGQTTTWSDYAAGHGSQFPGSGT